MSGKQLVRKFLVHAVAHARAVASILIVAGYVGFFLLPLATRDNFFDENSLLVVNSVPDIRSYVSKHEPKLAQSNAIQAEYKLLHTVPLEQLLRRHGLAAVRQQFLSPAGNFTCTNYHVSVPSGRGDGSESLALVTPLSSGCSHAPKGGLGNFREGCWQQSQAAGVAAVTVGVVVSKYMATVPWLARDFHWVIPDASCGLLHSTEAWIDAARGYRENGVRPTQSTRVGLLQQALVLEIQSLDFKTGDSKLGVPVEVSGVGFHGLLPKLDFFMLAEYFFRIDGRSHVRLPWRTTPLLQAVQIGLAKLETGGYGDKLLGMLSFLSMQVGGNPDGAHAVFKDYAVDAVTARIGAGSDKVERADAVTGAKVLRLASAVEGVLRCSNNLLERLHHSYFMYLQPNPKTFITIETYVLPACLMLLGLFLLAVSMLMPTCKPDSASLQEDALTERTTDDSAAAAVTEGPGAASTATGAADTPPQKVYPEKPQQPIRLLGGWPELSQGFCRVLVVHSVCAVAGIVLHWALAQYSGGHGLWDSVSVYISPPVLMSGAVSAGGLMALLASAGAAPELNSAEAQPARVERAISLFLTVLLMAAWMFVNWADVYMAMLCLVPNLLVASWGRAHHLSFLLGMGWLVVNPWSVAMASTDTSSDAPPVKAGGWPLLQDQWLLHVSFVTYLFVWVVYVPSWILPWSSLGLKRHTVKS